MADFPYTWPYSLFLAPRTLDQPINPGWSFGGVNINYQGNPAIERDVVEKVASFGKQLGIITDAVLELAGSKPKPNEHAVARLREIAAKIETLKKESKASLAAEARSAMERLAKTEPAAARRIATDYAKKGST